MLRFRNPDPIPATTPAGPAEEKHPTVDDTSPLYNTRVIKSYVSFLEKYHSGLDVDSLLAHAGITRPELDDPAHWLSQNQVDRWQEIVRQETRNPDIARDVGRSLLTSSGVGLFRQWVLGLMSLTSMYLLMEKIYPVLSRAATVQARKLGPNRIEILSTPKPGVHEKSFQCENRIGALESAGKLFTGEFAIVEHPACFHRGDECCRYLIRWKKSRTASWKRIRNVTFLANILACPVFFLAFPFLEGLLAVSLSTLCSLICSAYSDRLEKRDLNKTIRLQGHAAKDLLDELNVRYNNALLAQEMGETTAKVLDLDQRMNAIMKVMEQRLDFDGGFILLADSKKSQLRYATGFGLQERKALLLAPAATNLDDRDSNDLFSVVFRQQEPFLCTSREDVLKIQSGSSLAVLDQLEARSLICVPIVYEQESLGILTVFHTHGKRPLTTSDSNLLTGLASQAAVIINNAISFDRLRESEERYRTILESIEDGYYEVDIAGNFTFFNDAAANILGYSRDELMGMNNRQYTDEQSAKKLFRAFNKVYTTGEPARGFDWVVIRKDGSKRFVEASVSLKRDSAGAPMGFRGIVRDITKRKQAEEERILLETRLQRSKKMEALGTLAGGVAHDLNNILSGLVSYPELLLLDLPPDSPYEKPIQAIKKSGEKAATIVQDLLTLARRGVYVTEVVDLNDIVSEYLNSPECEMLKQYHPSVRLETRLSGSKLPVQGSPVHLSKAVMNLVSNAAEAIAEEGDVLITTKYRSLDPRAGGANELDEGDYVVLEVADTGMGISPEDLERIFEPFYTKKVMGRSGTGLGMAVVWGTVKDHKGAIDVRSTPQEGTVFTLYFPVSKNAAPAEKPKTSMDGYMGRGESVLIVDDVEEQREIASEMLMRLGYSVTSVSCGEEAIDHMKDNTADLVVLDMIMDPQIDGLETYEKILDLHPKQKAIIASGYSETERVKKALELGAGAYLRKPYTLERLGVTIKAQLETDRHPEH